MFIGSIVTAVKGILLYLVRMLVSSQMYGIKNSADQIVQIGAGTMRKKEYLKFAAEMIRKLTIGSIIFIMIAIVIFVLYYSQPQYWALDKSK